MIIIKVGLSRFFLLIHIMICLWIAAASCYSIIRDDKFVDYQGTPHHSNSNSSLIPIGVVLDTNLPLDSMLYLCMKIALKDSYEAHPNHFTKLHLHHKNAHTLLDANFAVIDLLDQERVECIIGPHGSTEDTFVSELGHKSHVPIISLTARTSSPASAPAENNFFIRTSVDDSFQTRALAALCQGFQWPQIVLLYEDTEYGRQFISPLTNALRAVQIGLVYLTPIPSSASSSHLSEMLTLLNEQETRVFLVHTTPSLGFKIFDVAKNNVGMMEAGNVWIITDSMSNFMGAMDSSTRDLMEGVVGVRPYVPSSKDLTDFKEKWERVSSRASMDLNVYGLWAYDTIKALAIAAENVGPVTPPTYDNHSALRISSYGPRLLREFLRTSFRGVSGYFKLVDRSLKPSQMEILYWIGTGERRIGVWDPKRGLMREPRSSSSSSGVVNYSTSTKELRNVVWPGDSTITPKGWSIPPSGCLRVGVPWKHGFKQFVDVVVDPTTNVAKATGFAIDIFLNALAKFPFPVNYTFYCCNESASSNWSYASMLHNMSEKYDIIVADTTIWAPRSLYVDFSLPYLESGVVWVVRNNKPLNMWIFTKPLSWDLWLTTLGVSIFIGVVIWRLEYKLARNPEVETRHKDRLEIALLVPVAALAFQERGLVGSRTAVFVLACWLLTAFVLMQSYTANLSAILTLDQIKFSFSEDKHFGYLEGSFTEEILTRKLNISPTRLISYKSVEEYHEGMRRGSKNGGVDAIFDELPYMKLLLNQYESQYKIIGPTYTTDGLGFAFPIGSPLVAYFSRAILNVTQGPEMTALQQKNLGPAYSSQDPLLNTVSQGASSLTSRDFAGLFFIVGGLTTLAILCAETKILKIFKQKGQQLINKLRAYRNEGYRDVRNGGENVNAMRTRSQ